MFDISFIDAEPEIQAEGWPGLWGRIVLGMHSERFLAPVAHWSREAYESQWLEAADRLLGPEARAGFFTSAFQFWWTMWRFEDRVFVREEFLTPGRLDNLNNGRTTPHHLIGEYEAQSEGGDRISEWEVDAADICEFIARRFKVG